MTLTYVLEPGDCVSYPNLNLVEKDSEDAALTCIDRKVKIYRKTGKYYISYLFDGLTESLIKEMKQNIENKLDNLVVIHGGEGVGKSHLGYYIATQFDPNFDMSTNYIYNYSTFLKRITEDIDKPPGTVYWLDEASNIAGNRDWMHQDNKEFINILEMFRSKGWTLILCIPKISRLDVYIRETRARFILKAAIMSWDYNKNGKARGYYSLTRVDDTEDYRMERKIGYGKFPPIPEGIDIEYEQQKTSSQTEKLLELNELQEAKGKKGNTVKEVNKRNRALILDAYESGKSIQYIQKITGLEEKTIYNYITQAKKERNNDE